MHGFCRRLFGILSLLAVAMPVYSAEEVAKPSQVEIYTASYCSDCKRAKAYMATHNIAFKEHDVEFDLVSRKAFYAMGGKGVPLLIIKGQQMHGFNAEKLEKLRQ